MKNKRVISLILVLLSFSIFLTACSSSNENEEGQVLYDDIEEGEIEEDEEGTEEEGESNTDEKEGVEVSSEYDTLDFSSGKSIYIEQLEGRVQQAFTEIRKAALAGEKEVVLETVITDKDLERIMNILLLDSPEVIGLSNTYSYKADNIGNVSKVKLNYFLTPEYIKLANVERGEVIKDAQKIYTDEKTLKKDVVFEVVENHTTTHSLQSFKPFNFNLRAIKNLPSETSIEEIGKVKYSEIEESFLNFLHQANGDGIRGGEARENIPGIDYNSYKSFVNSDIVGSPYMPLTNLKGKISVLRELGFDASVVAGEFVSYDLIPDNDPLDIYNFVEAKKTKKITEGKDGYKDVYLDPYNYYFWIVIEVDDEYYIYDLDLSRLVNYKLTYGVQNEAGPNINDNKSLFYDFHDFTHFQEDFYNLVPDYLISGSRMMFYNEDILGVPPAARDDNLGNLKDSEHYVDTLITSEIKTEAKNFIDKIIKETNSGEIEVRVFKDRSKLDEFAMFFEEQIEEMNENSKHAIKEYDTLKIPILNMYVVYNILK